MNALNVSETQLSTANTLLTGQRRVLERLAMGHPLEAVLDELVRVVEPLTHGMLLSILLLEPGRKTLRTGAAPSLPKEYCELIEKETIGPTAGSCGTAAYWKRPVFVENIEEDPLWETYRTVAQRFHLKSCWSMPILSSQGDVLGTFAMYDRKPRSPEADELQLIRDTTHLAAIAIENARTVTSLKNTVSLLHATLNSTVDGIIVVNHDGKIVSYNEKFEQIWQIPPQVLRENDDQTALSFVLDQLKDPKIFMERVQTLYSNPDQEGHDILEFKDGRIVERYSKPQMLDGHAVGRVWSFRDITAHRQAEDAALSASLAKERFLANISHEIRTPLGAIIGFSELLLSDVELSDEALDWITRIRDNGTHLKEIVDEILDFSKAESTGCDVDLKEVDLEKTLADLISIFEPKTRAKNIALDLKFETSVPARVISDPTRLKQILINIIGNAVKFTDHGRVSVITRFEAPKKLIFAIEDTGIGIPLECSRSLFVPFSQVDPSRKRRKGGTGLGLVLSKRFAEALGGDVRIDWSEFGKGSRFKVELNTEPVPGTWMINEIPERQAQPSSMSAERELKPLRGHDILVVEDSRDNQLLFARILRLAGARVDFAANGAEAIEKGLKKNYSVILMDIQMPGVDGYEATERLRHEGYRGPIIALTAHALPTEHEQAIKAGCDEQITKPCPRRLLIETLTKFAGHTVH